METIIAKLLGDFENGKMNRRQLIQSLALAATAASAASAGVSPVPAGAGFKTIALDHISFSVVDYKRTRDFYADLMGMAVTDDNRTSQCTLHIGDQGDIIARNHNQRQGQPVDPNPKPNVGHIAYKIADWDTNKVKAELERRGLKPRPDTGGGNSGYASFHVSDPDGFDLQISGDPKPGDPWYKKPGA